MDDSKLFDVFSQPKKAKAGDNTGGVLAGARKRVKIESDEAQDQSDAALKNGISDTSDTADSNVIGTGTRSVTGNATDAVTAAAPELTDEFMREDIRQVDAAAGFTESKEKLVSKPKTADVGAADTGTPTPDVTVATLPPAVVDAAQIATDKPLTGAVAQKVTLSHHVRHQVAIPPGYPYVPLSQHVPPEKPARTYPFELDSFQKLSIASIERNESVLVSAHTSAGKTVVAEYAIAQSLKHKQRVIYTSPIKALSNQKYRELVAEFGDVGLMTGDVTINQDATCLVMTTEILRLMLYRGSEIMREAAWVIFDEIHYMRDRERGVIWEETIILLPDNVHYVFLSATIPNAFQFAQWIAKIHNQACHVVYTNFRPTPLQHYLFPAGGDGIYLVVDERSTFREDNFQRAMAALSDKGAHDESEKSTRGNKRKTDDRRTSTDIYKLIKMIISRNNDPVIVFSFSKRECESYALKMSRLDLTTDDEKAMINEVFENATNSLAEGDKSLPQVQQILGLLKRGIGVHHSGLLPILKEIIEILFQESLIKVLFATETFSIGLNMPAKTVLFTSVRKFDGKDFRTITSGEYIQMSGRAGRRGLDDRGIVILMVDEKLEPATAKGMLTGEADRLDSAFYLSYNMILNLMRVEGITPETIIERSFSQFQTNAALPMIEKKLIALESEFDETKIKSENDIADYYDIKQQIKSYELKVREICNHPDYCLPFIQPGRLIKIKTEDSVFDWAVIVSYNKRIAPKGKDLNDFKPQETYIIDVVLHISSDSLPKVRNFRTSVQLRPPKEGENSSHEIVPVLLSTIFAMSQVRIPMPKDLHSSEARASVWRSVQEVKKHFPNGIPVLDPVEHLKIKDKDFQQILAKTDVLEMKLTANALTQSPQLVDLYKQYSDKMSLQGRITEKKQEIAAARSVIQLDELKARKRVLRRLEFTNVDDVISLKGRVACEINSADELVATELIFNGLFSDLTPEQCVSVLSCFVCQEKGDDDQKPRNELLQSLEILRESARRVAKISQESKLFLNENDYVDRFHTTLMDVVYLWATGAPFSSICKVTEVYEGSLVRAFKRLEELLTQISEAAKAIGNYELDKKMTQGIEKIHRGIIFSASLYL